MEERGVLLGVIGAPSLPGVPAGYSTGEVTDVVHMTLIRKPV